MSKSKVDISITGNTADLTSFVQFLKTLSWCCGVGASRSFVVNVDGDGSADLHVDFGATDVSKVELLNTDKEPIRVYIGE